MGERRDVRRDRGAAHGVPIPRDAGPNKMWVAPSRNKLSINYSILTAQARDLAAAKTWTRRMTTFEAVRKSILLLMIYQHQRRRRKSKETKTLQSSTKDHCDILHFLS